MLKLTDKTKFRILDALGIHYIELETDDHNILIIPKFEAAQAYEALTSTGQFTGEEAIRFRDAIFQRGLLDTWDDVRAAIAKAPRPERVWTASFQLCSCGNPNRHVHLYNAAGEKLMRDPIHSIFEGVTLTHVLLEEGHVDLETGIHLLQQLVELDLPSTEEEMKARYAALPAEVREMHERSARQNNPLAGLLEAILRRSPSADPTAEAPQLERNRSQQHCLAPYFLP